MKSPSSQVAYITAIAAALFLSASSFSAEYAKHLHGPGFPFGMVIAACLLTFAYWLVIFVCFRLGQMLLGRSRVARLTGNVCLALLGALSIAFAFAPLALFLKAVRFAAPAPQVWYLTEQHLYDLATNSVSVTMLLLFIPLFLAMLAFESQLATKRTRGENAL